jgi:hypothetical protein
MAPSTERGHERAGHARRFDWAVENAQWRQ